MPSRFYRLSGLLLIAAVLTTAITAGAITAEEWLDRIDHNMYLASAQSTAKMTIHLPNGQERTFRMTSKVQGDDKALIEYLEPPRDRGTRYLKNGDNLWIYFPRQDRTLLIQGHMLRQSVQGSEMSFEDISESQSMREMYTASLLSETDSTVVLQLEARDMTVSYPFREITIEKSTGLPVKMINSGVGNRPIKEMIIVERQQIGNRWFPVVSEIRSLLTENKWTRFEVEEIELGVAFPEGTFTKRGLSR